MMPTKHYCKILEFRSNSMSLRYVFAAPGGSIIEDADPSKPSRTEFCVFSVKEDYQTLKAQYEVSLHRHVYQTLMAQNGISLSRKIYQTVKAQYEVSLHIKIYQILKAQYGYRKKVSP